MSAITFAGVTKDYGAISAVDHATFEIPDGAWCVVTGPNGSGKTTLLQLASGLQEPTTGSVSVDGVRAGSRPARNELSMLVDSPAFFSDLTIRDHFDYVAGIFDDHEVVERGVNALERFGLASRADDLPDTFSRGMKQKAGIALAIARPASVLVLDEPTRGLDERGVRELVSMLRERNREGTTVVTVTHDPDEFSSPEAIRLRMSEGHVEVDYLR